MRFLTDADLPPERKAQLAKDALQRAEKAKDPTKLTDKERLTRIEIVLGLDEGG